MSENTTPEKESKADKEPAAEKKEASTKSEKVEKSEASSQGPRERSSGPRNNNRKGHRKNGGGRNGQQRGYRQVMASARNRGDDGPVGGEINTDAIDQNVDLSDVKLTDAEKKSLSSKELHQKEIKELTALAEKLKIENAAGMRRQDMIFHILKRAAQLGEDIHGYGVLEILDNGYGF